MEYTIAEVARVAGTTSRTLRHYGALGLLPPSRVAGNGYRHYDSDALIRLQRILLLRDLGLSLEAIGEILDRQLDAPTALRGHLEWLRREQQRIGRQAESVELTIVALEGGEELMAENMFEGFDHTEYREEVEQRWGAEAYRRSDQWWRSKSATEKSAWQAQQAQLSADWADAANRGVASDGEEAMALAARHVAWLAGIPGTPRDATGAPSAAYVVGLGEMYVADERFGANYGGTAGAEFVRDALAAFVR